MTLSNVLLKLIYASYYRQLSFVIIMNTHRWIRVNNVTFKTFNNGDFQIELISNTMLAIRQNDVHVYAYIEKTM